MQYFVNCIVFFLWCLTVLQAQNQEADSLKKHLAFLQTQYAPEDTVVINCLNAISYTMRNNAHDSALVYAGDALQRATKIHYLKGQADAILTQGVVAIYEGHYSAALDFHLRSMEIYETIRDSANQGNVLNNIGFLYKSQGNFPMALDYFSRAEVIFKASNHLLGLALVWGNLGDIAFKKGQFDEALRYENDALKLVKPDASTLLERYFAGVAFYHIGMIYLAQKKYDSAHSYQQRALQIFLADGNRAYAIRSFDNLAAIYEATKDYEKAFSIAKRGLEMAERFNVALELVLMCERLSGLYERVGNSTLALSYYRRTTNLRDSLTSLNIEQRIKILDMMRKAEQSGKELIKVEAQQQKLRWVRNSLIGGMLLVVTLLFLAVNRYKYISRSEKELRASNDIILRQQRELQSINSSLGDANKRLATLNTEKDELLSIVAHDLKNPLTGIILASSALHRDVELQKDISREKIKTATQRISGSSERMMNIIMKLLRSNVLEERGNQFNIQKFNITNLGREIVEEHLAHAQSKSLTLTFIAPEEPLFAYADSDACAEIIENLLDNALKYSPKDKKVSVRITKELPVVHASEESGESSRRILSTHTDSGNSVGGVESDASKVIRIEVQDEGPGLTVEDKQQLFQKFTRLSAQPTNGEHSTGLGLNIVKRLVDGMSGHIWCESESGNGATFVVEIPSA